MKYLVILFICFSSFCTFAQEEKTEFDGHKWEAPYHLAIPTGWTIERFLIPIGFAPQIPYKGVEDIRFAPGWANAKSEQYWSYAFLWYLDSMPVVSAAIIENNLKAYYTGLLNVNTDPAKLTTLSEKEKEVRTSFKEVQTNNEDLKTFNGTVEMLDYMQLKRIMLNCIVHVKTCTQDKKAILFFELSQGLIQIPSGPVLTSFGWTLAAKRNDGRSVNRYNTGL